MAKRLCNYLATKVQGIYSAAAALYKGGACMCIVAMCIGIKLGGNAIESIKRNKNYFVDTMLNTYVCVR